MTVGCHLYYTSGKLLANARSFPLAKLKAVLFTTYSCERKKD
jgi:hypothetical protein